MLIPVMSSLPPQKRRLSATKLPTPPERRKSSVVHADLKAVALEVVIGGGGPNSEHSNDGRRKESRSGSLPDIQVRIAKPSLLGKYEYEVSHPTVDLGWVWFALVWVFRHLA